MSFAKATETFPVPFGMYHLDHDYVNALKKADNNVIDPNENDLYCGPAFTHQSERGLVAFFVPVDISTYDEYDVLPMTLYLGKLGGDFLDFTKMIPVVNERFLSRDILRNDVDNYITKIRPRIEECAEFAIGVQQGTIDPKNSNINEGHTLEDRMRSYKKTT